MTAATLPLTLSEADFQRTVLDYAVLRSWRCVHIRPLPNRRGQWSTPYEGHPGLPDLILARDGRLLLVELKSQGGRLSREQSAWLDAIGPHGRVWKPCHWPTIVEELR